ncbi:MAG: hypothetical protein AAFQ20_03315 [Bacteroidota bacterium]
MKKLQFLAYIATFLLISACGSDDGPNVDNDPTQAQELSEQQEAFIEEYEYVTFNFSPTSFGGDRNEKWSGVVRLSLEGTIVDSYRQGVENQLEVWNNFITDGTRLELTDDFSNANIRLYLGQESEIESLWPDMYDRISAGNFSGYALFNRDGNFNITVGRIWVKNTSIPLFDHELGHIMGLGHSSTNYCQQFNDPSRSFMCSGLAPEFSSFDAAMIKTLYHPDIEVGRTFSQLRPIVRDLLLSEAITIE